MNKTIHELEELTQAEATDELIVFDVSDAKSKKVKVQNLVRFKVFSGTYTINNGFVTINPQMADNTYKAFAQTTYSGGATNLVLTTQSYQSDVLYVYVRDGAGNIPANGTQITLNILIAY